MLGKKVIEGKLVDYDEDQVKIYYNGEIIELKKSLIAIMKPLIKF